MPAVARPPQASPGPLPCAGSACCLRSTLELLPGTRSPDAEAVEEVVLETHFTTRMERCKVEFSMPPLEPTPSRV